MLLLRTVGVRSRAPSPQFVLGHLIPILGLAKSVGGGYIGGAKYALSCRPVDGSDLSTGLLFTQMGTQSA